MTNKNISFEPRRLNVIYSKSKSGSISTKLSIPITWLKELGVTEENREVILIKEGDKLIIKKD